MLSLSSERHPFANANVRPSEIIGIALYIRKTVHSAPRFHRVGHHRLAVVLDNPTHRQSVTGGVAAALLKDARLTGHVANETMHLVVAAYPLNAEAQANSHRTDTADDSARKDTMIWEAKRNAVTFHDCALELRWRHAAQQAVVMRAPTAQHPVVGADVAEALDQMAFVAARQMHRKRDFARRKFLRDVFLKIEEVLRGHCSAKSQQRRL